MKHKGLLIVTTCCMVVLLYGMALVATVSNYLCRPHMKKWSISYCMLVYMHAGDLQLLGRQQPKPRVCTAWKNVFHFTTAMLRSVICRRTLSISVRFTETMEYHRTLTWVGLKVMYHIWYLLPGGGHSYFSLSVSPDIYADRKVGSLKSGSSLLFLISCQQHIIVTVVESQIHYHSSWKPNLFRKFISEWYNRAVNSFSTLPLYEQEFPKDNTGAFLEAN